MVLYTLPCWEFLRTQWTTIVRTTKPIRCAPTWMTCSLTTNSLDTTTPARKLCAITQYMSSKPNTRNGSAGHSKGCFQMVLHRLPVFPCQREALGEIVLVHSTTASFSEPKTSTVCSRSCRRIQPRDRTKRLLRAVATSAEFL